MRTMPKSLLLLRHAKSSWKDDDLPDHDRPLNPRGRRDAPKIGRLMVDEDLLPDAVCCSTAVRARQTYELLVAEWPRRPETQFTKDLYLCPANRLPDILRKVSADASRVLLIGHNPGMADFLAQTVGLAGKFPTAALAWLTLELEAWPDFDAGQPLRLEHVWRPRELE
jgi:phosphohistidine phosphatase